jgi:hypothetical protein
MHKGHKNYNNIVIPAKAGIHTNKLRLCSILDSRFRGNDTLNFLCAFAALRELKNIT